MRRISFIAAAVVLLSMTCVAQLATVTVTPLTDSDIQMLRSDLQDAKTKIITDTMQFPDAEAAAFWPVYKEYAKEQQSIGNDRVQLIKDYALHYDTLNDSQAKDLMQRQITIENRTLTLRETYWPKFEKAIGAKRAAKFYQVDNRLSLMINFQLAADIPLIP